MMLIRKSVEADFAVMLAIINDATRAYRGVIPADRWHDPYMAKKAPDGSLTADKAISTAR